MYDINRRGFRKPFPFKYFHVSFWIIGINVLVYFLAERIYLYNGQLRVLDLIALNPLLIAKYGIGQWGVFTYMFAHGGFAHLFFNMLILFMIGPALEQKMGSWEFLLYYLLTGMLVGIAALLVYLQLGIYNPLVGASGAIFAVLLGFATYYPHAIIRIWGIIPIRAPLLVLGYTAVEIFGILRSAFSTSPDNISHLAHLFGLIFGFLYLISRIGINPIKAFTQKNSDQIDF